MARCSSNSAARSSINKSDRVNEPDSHSAFSHSVCRSGMLLRLPQSPLMVPWLAPESLSNGARADCSEDCGSERASPTIQLSLVIPTYNERENLPGLLEHLSATLDSLLPQAYEVIVVDDDSCDRTWELALELSRIYPALRVMRRQTEQGLATAVVRGWQQSQGAVLGVMDADGQHPTEVIGSLLRTLELGFDVAIASRYSTGGQIQRWSYCRRLLSWGAQALGWLILPEVVGQVKDPMSGCFLMRRQAIAGQPLYPMSYKILVEVLARGQANRIAEVGYVFQPRQGGFSKVGWRQYRDYLLHLARLRWALWGRQFGKTGNRLGG